MRIAVTGGCGRIGSLVLQELLDCGHEPVCIDRRLPEEPVCRSLIADMTDFGQAAGALRGTEAVIHLAAIPGARSHPAHVVFNTNATSHYNVLEAAEALGIRKVASASSVQALGHVGAVDPPWPRSFPVDETYRVHPEHCYALSKEVGEHINRMFARRGMQAVGLRFTAVMRAESVRDLSPEQLDRRETFWSYVDPRDVAQICRLSVEADGLGAETFHVAAADTLREEKSVDLVRRYFPDAEIRDGLEGHATCLDISKARRMLGYDPKHTWRDVR